MMEQATVEEHIASLEVLISILNTKLPLSVTDQGYLASVLTSENFVRLFSLVPDMHIVDAAEDALNMQNGRDDHHVRLWARYITGKRSK